MTTISPTTRRRFLAITGASVLLAGCAQPGQRLVETHYGLNLALKPLNLPNGAVIAVERVRTNGIFAARQLVERVSSSPVSFIETRGKLWHSAPGDMLQDALVRAWNTASGRKIASTSSRGKALRLELTLSELSFASDGSGIAAFHAELTGANRRVLLDRDYRATGPANGATADAAVLSMEKALGTALDQLAADIAQA